MTVAETRTRMSAEVTKREFLRLVASGLSGNAAITRLGKSKKLLDYYRRTDPEWAEEWRRIRSRLEQEKQPDYERKPVPDFPEFCETYLGMRLHRHQLQWFDLLQGREPRDLHPRQQYDQGNPKLLCVNTPPEHAKSTTLTVAYTVWCLCRDPDDLIVIVSKTREKAKEFLGGVKNRLTHPKFKKLQQDFGPVEGFDSNSQSWTSDRIWLSPDVRDPEEKDPNVQAIGIAGHIYGTRARTVIIDDPVDNTNVQQFTKQINWISGEIVSRVGRSGKVLLIGTRIEPVDLYREIRNPVYYPNSRTGKSPWTYLSQPAILEDADEANEMVTLWPKSNRPMQGDVESEADENGDYPAWDGPALADKRETMTAHTWALMYQQEEIGSDQTFPLDAIRGCINGNRVAGPMQRGNPYHRAKRGMAGLHVVAGLDPAVSKPTGAIVIGLDLETGKRYVLDVFAKPTQPHEIFDLMRQWTDQYGVQEWRIEKNGMNLMITQNREIRNWLANRGVILTPHYTGDNKWDPAFGVASMATLFDGWKDDAAMIELPSPHNHLHTRTFVHQLSVWSPHSDPKVVPQDTVMAMWFAEMKCRELADSWFTEDYLDKNNPFLSQGDKDGQVVIDLNDTELLESMGIRWD